MNRIIIAMILGLISVSSYASGACDITVRANPATCIKGQYCVLTSHHDVVVQNDTDENLNYHYALSICADNGDCRQKTEDFTVNAHSHWQRDFTLTLNTRFMVDYVTHYNHAITELSGADHMFKDQKTFITLYNK